MSHSPSLEQIFHAALALRDGPERAAYLKQACGMEAKLRSQVEALLRADSVAGDYFGEAGDDDGVSAAALGESAGDWIDRYKLLEKLGEGGFGSVWMAEQREPFRRHVALKVIKLGMDTRQVIARFEAERQALALMDHPNIARVLEAGATETGRPFFVMELVRGLPILEYCDGEQLDTAARLELFTSVCHAIQHAHQKGVIHRDIKPSNVLVTLHDGVPVPVVIDFGIAKATDQELTAKTLFTAHRQIVGTPAYMSPEQAELSGLDVDTRSDVYSLGVLLYELLTGTTPFDAQRLLEAGYDEMLRAIREEEPHKPSTRVSTLGQTAARTAARRRTDVKKLGLILRGDLDWIVMKCLEKARGRRYETANGLAADIQRHLEDEPVSARPPSLGYRLQKAVKRHRAAALALAAVASALVIGALGTTIGWVRADRQKVRAESAEVVAQANADQAAYQSYVGFMLAAKAARKQGNYPEAKRLHGLCPESYRGWEWHHLDVALNLTQALEGHAGEVLAVAFSPDGRRIVSASEDEALRLWDAETGTTVRVLEGHAGSVVAVAFSPDGRRIVSGSRDRTLRFWDAETGDTVRVLEGHTQRVVAVACSPDGRRIVSTSPERVRFWSVESGELRRVLESPCHTIAFSPDGRQLASSLDTSISIRDSETGDTLSVLNGHSAAVTGVAFSPDGRRIVSSSDDNSLRIWDVQTGDTVRVLNGHLSYTYSPAFSPDGRSIVSASNDGTLRLWDAESGETVQVLRGHGERVLAAAFNPDGRSIVSGSRDRTLRIWNLDGGQAVQVLEGPARGVFAVAFSPDGRRLASGSEDSLVRIWDAATGDVMHVRDEHADKVFSVAFSPDGRRLVTGSKDALIFRDAATGEPIRELERRGAVALGLAFSADSRRIFTSTGDHAITIWDAETGETLRAWNTGGGVYGLAVRPDDRRIASVGARGPVKIWNANTGELVQVLEGHTTHAFGAAYSPDGRRLVTGGWDKTARVWDAETGEPLHVLTGHAWRLNRVAFSPDGRRIATSAWDHTVRIWDAETGAALHVLEGHTDWVYDVAFGPDGRRLVSASLDGTLRLWESRMEDVESQVRGRLRRERVRPRVSALFDEHGFVEPVLAALRADTSLSDEERRTALLMARADAARELDEQAWSRVDPDRVDRETDVALGLQLARASLERNTTSPDLHNTLAWALFANGLHDEAIAASEKAHQLSIDQRWQHIPERMVEFQGHLERLRTQIDQGR